MSAQIAYRNGEFQPANGLSVSVQDAGFVWGATVTERVRTFRGELFRLQEHIERFRESCRLAYIPLTETDEELLAISRRLASENRMGYELTLIWLASPGIVTRFTYSGLPEERLPTRIAFTQPILSIHYFEYQGGVSLITVPSTLGVDPTIKHRSRLPWWIALQGVRETNRSTEPLFMDPDTGNLLETCSANILFVIDGKLASPPKGSVLEGVSLRVVAELASSLGITFERRPIHRSEIAHASEAILTSTTFCLAKVLRIDEHVFSSRSPVLVALDKSWREMVGTVLLDD